MLILGTLPPPVGGVTIHVERLLGFLDKNDMSYVFLSLRTPLRIVLYKSLPSAFLNSIKTIWNNISGK